MTTKLSFLFCFFLQGVFASDNLRYVNITEYPYHVSIEKYDVHSCSGALLHESWVITAASCVFGFDPSVITVRVRASTLCNGEVVRVDGIVVHEEFNKFMLFSDIALIKLKIPVQFGEKLLPIGLPEVEDHRVNAGTTCFVTGWRQTVAGPVESRLTVTAVPLVDQNTCESKLPCYEPVVERILCAGNMTYGVETCQGDPGAPLMEGQTLIGVLSHGLGCKTMIHPGVYTRVSSYLAWIFANSGIRYT